MARDGNSSTYQHIRSRNAIDVFTDLTLMHGVPVHIHSDNGPEMIAKKLMR